METGKHSILILGSNLGKTLPALKLLTNTTNSISIGTSPISSATSTWTFFPKMVTKYLYIFMIFLKIQSLTFLVNDMGLRNDSQKYIKLFETNAEFMGTFQNFGCFMMAVSSCINPKSTIFWEIYVEEHIFHPKKLSDFVFRKKHANIYITSGLRCR